MVEEGGRGVSDLHVDSSRLLSKSSSSCVHRTLPWSGPTQAAVPQRRGTPLTCSPRVWV